MRGMENFTGHAIPKPLVQGAIHLGFVVAFSESLLNNNNNNNNS